MSRSPAQFALGLYCSTEGSRDVLKFVVSRLAQSEGLIKLQEYAVEHESSLLAYDHRDLYSHTVPRVYGQWVHIQEKEAIL